MTTEQKQIKLARACGWKGIPEQFLVGYSPNRTVPYEWAVRQCPADDLGSIPLDPLPDYANDRDAIIEAVESLPYERQPYYMDNLTRRVMMKDEGVSDFERHNATAAQRFEALGITLGLWEAGE